MRGILVGLVLLATGAVSCGSSSPAGSAAPRPLALPPSLDLTLRPVCGADGEPTALDVEVATPVWSASPPSFRIADPHGGPQRIRELLSEVRMSDARGELPTTAVEALDPVDHEPRYFVRGTRTATGTVTLRYRARSVSTAEKGPRFGLRHDENGIGGTGDGLFLTPELDAPMALRIHWITGGCKPDLVPLSALGNGEQPPASVSPPSSLRQAGFFLARADQAAVDDGNMHLRFSFVGKPRFDRDVAVRYAADVLRAERAAFGDADSTPFYAMMRLLPEMTKNVTGGGNAFGYTSVVGPDAEWDARMRDHIAHELMHHWVGVGLWLVDSEKVNSYWFTEGFTVHYSRVIPLRLGLISPADFLEQQNKIARPYYSSPLRAASNRQIEDAIDRELGDPTLGLMPYWRGALYAAELDAAIRRTSGGVRSLDGMMKTLHDLAKSAPRNASGYRELPESAFRGLVFTELGQAGVDRFEAVIHRGEAALPPSDAFGPCFERIEPKPGEYEWSRIEAVPDAECMMKR